jgi:hypothetical protein
MPLTDTTPDAERVLRESYRRMPFERRWQQMGAIYRTARMLHRAGVLARNPAATPADIAADWRAAALGDLVVPPWKGEIMEGNQENVVVVEKVIDTLSRLGIPYALGGSWASSLFGKMRFTHDADITVEPFSGKEADFVASFDDDYYVDRTMVEEAVRKRSSFNIIYLPQSFKVDIFVRKDRPFDQSLMGRRQVRSLHEKPDTSVFFVSPEDIILLKLEWFRLGGEVSDRQWMDILGVIEIQGERLDQAYLDLWAGQLGVADLLARARQESGD